MGTIPTSPIWCRILGCRCTEGEESASFPHCMVCGEPLECVCTSRTQKGRTTWGLSTQAIQCRPHPPFIRPAPINRFWCSITPVFHFSCGELSADLTIPDPSFSPIVFTFLTAEALLSPKFIFDSRCSLNHKYFGNYTINCPSCYATTTLPRPPTIC